MSETVPLVSSFLLKRRKDNAGKEIWWSRVYSLRMESSPSSQNNMFHLKCLLLSFLFLTYYQLVAQVTDSPTILTREEAPQDGCSKRTLSQILWTCLSTTIICAWNAVHPNILPREGSLMGTLRRVELMLWTIIAPEILPCWALKQLLAAMNIRDVYNSRVLGYKDSQLQKSTWETIKRFIFRIFEAIWESLLSLFKPSDDKPHEWTLRHGFFLIMGGFHLIEPAGAISAPNISETEQDSESVISHATVTSSLLNGPTGRVTILTFELLKEVCDRPDFKVQVTDDDIADKSKGDALSKFILILQSSWFITQCVMRRVRGYDLTQIELTTLALASLNAITLGLWWYKPLGARTPIRVYLENELTERERNAGRDENSESTRSKFISHIQSGFAFCLTNIRDIFLCPCEGNIFVAWFIKLPFLLLGLFLSPIIILCMTFVYTISDLLLVSSLPADATRVPTFYSPAQENDYLHFSLLLVLGSLFGGIHSAGWSYIFPSPIEQTLWRVCSLALTTIPMVALLVGITLFKTNHYRGNVAGFVFLAIAIVLCMVVRLTLLGLAVAALRKLPPSAFSVVNWVKALFSSLL